MTITSSTSSTSSSSAASSATAVINPELLDQLYGTWTFVSQSEADLGYYKAKAYLVVHFMPDPSQATLGCATDKCDEFQNQLCQDAGSTCVNTETTMVQWSDVAALYQFGFQVDTGFAIKSHIRQGTGDWLGPYNVILAEAPPASPKKQIEEEEGGMLTETTSRRLMDQDDPSPNPLYVSRLVQTASSQYIYPPPHCDIVSGDHFAEYAGLAAIQHSIQTQTSSGDPLDSYLSQDPYADYLGTCDHGSLEPILPRFTIQQQQQQQVGSNSTNNTTSAVDAAPTLEFSLRYPILSLPYKNNQLTKWWPTLQKRLSKNNNLITGPYCFDGALKAYTIDLNFTQRGQDPTWQFVKGCVNGLPCWHDIPPDGGKTHPGIPDATSAVILKWVNHYLGAPGLIALSVLLVLSLICNLRLCCKVRAKRRRVEELVSLQTRGGGDEEVGTGTTSATTTTTTTTRQRRQASRRTAASRSQPAQSSSTQSTPQRKPRSAQILTPSRFERKREPSSSSSSDEKQLHTRPLLPKKSDPSAPSQPSMDRTPAPKKAPQGGEMDRTPIVNKPAAAVAKKEGSWKEPSGSKTVIITEEAAATTTGTTVVDQE